MDDTVLIPCKVGSFLLFFFPFILFTLDVYPFFERVLAEKVANFFRYRIYTAWGRSRPTNKIFWCIFYTFSLPVLFGHLVEFIGKWFRCFSIVSLLTSKQYSEIIEKIHLKIQFSSFTSFLRIFCLWIESQLPPPNFFIRQQKKIYWEKCGYKPDNNKLSQKLFFRFFSSYTLISFPHNVTKQVLLITHKIKVTYDSEWLFLAEVESSTMK